MECTITSRRGASSIHGQAVQSVQMLTVIVMAVTAPIQPISTIRWAAAIPSS